MGSRGTMDSKPCRRGQEIRDSSWKNFNNSKMKQSRRKSEDGVLMPGDSMCTRKSRRLLVYLSPQGSVSPERCLWRRRFIEFLDRLICPLQLNISIQLRLKKRTRKKESRRVRSTLTLRQRTN